MEEIVCPLDNKPCEKDCPDRYKDVPEGGCPITTMLEMGICVIVIKED